MPIFATLVFYFIFLSGVWIQYNMPQRKGVIHRLIENLENRPSVGLHTEKINETFDKTTVNKL
jgi:hypothetical protein